MFAFSNEFIIFFVDKIKPSLYPSSSKLLGFGIIITESKVILGSSKSFLESQSQFIFTIF